MQKDNRPASASDIQTGKPAPDQKRPRFLDQDPPRRVPLGRVRTDDEARLAAEIEKLR